MKVQFSNSSSEVVIELNTDDVQRLAESETLENAGISISFDLDARHAVVSSASFDWCEQELARARQEGFLDD